MSECEICCGVHPLHTIQCANACAKSLCASCATRIADEACPYCRGNVDGFIPPLPARGGRDGVAEGGRRVRRRREEEEDDLEQFAQDPDDFSDLFDEFGDDFFDSFAPFDMFGGGFAQTLGGLDSFGMHRVMGSGGVGRLGRPRGGGRGSARRGVGTRAKGAAGRGVGRARAGEDRGSGQLSVFFEGLHGRLVPVSVGDDGSWSITHNGTRYDLGIRSGA